MKDNENKKIKNEKTRKIINICIFTVVAILAITATIIIFPKIMKLTDETERQLFEEKIEQLGFKGVVIMFLIQVIQVVLAAIPGEPVEIILGVLYGAIPGCLICLAGAAVGTVIIYLCVQKFGRNFVDKFINSDGFEKLKFLFLKSPAKRDIVLFILFFIPGTPKDILVYFAPFTKIPLSRLLVISLVGRIPSVLSSTFVGSNIADGNFLMSVLMFAGVGIVSLAGILTYNKIIKNENKTNNNNISESNK